MSIQYVQCDLIVKKKMTLVAIKPSLILLFTSAFPNMVSQNFSHEKGSTMPTFRQSLLKGIHGVALELNDMGNNIF